MLDPDDPHDDHVASPALPQRRRNSPSIPDNILENAQKADFVCFSKQYFDLIKGIYNFEHDSLLTNIAIGKYFHYILVMETYCEWLLECLELPIVIPFLNLYFPILNLVF